MPTTDRTASVKWSTRHKLAGTIIGPVLWVFANGTGDQGLISGRVIPKTFKMVLNISLLNTQQYKIRIEDKVEQSRERSSVPLHLAVVAIEKGAFWSPSTTVANFNFTYYQNFLSEFLRRSLMVFIVQDFQTKYFLMYSQCFGRYVIQPSSDVSCRTWEPTWNVAPRPLFNPRGSFSLIPLTITGEKCKR